MPSACRISNSTVVPVRPRTRSTAFSTLQPSVDSPSISRMMSPARIPARSAGVPGSGWTITTKLCLPCDCRADALEGAADIST